MSDLDYPNASPFYKWLDHERLRELVHGALRLAPGERLVLIKGLMPGLVESLGIDAVEEFVGELALKARRYDEARTHPGEGRAERATPGELLGGPTPDGHVHACTSREPDCPGGRAAERRVEQSLWSVAQADVPPSAGK